MDATLADGGGSPFDCAAQEEVRERVEAALRQVPEVFRTVVVLREIEGFTYEEIADILHVNLGTVKSRLTRGRAVLRGLLAPEKRKPHGIGRTGVHGGVAMNLKSCTEIQARFSSYLDGTISGHEMHGDRAPY